MSDAPEWSRTSVRLWTEDDSGDRNRETASDAWFRLFGEHVSERAKADTIETYDYGDGSEQLRTQGRIYGYCCEGGYIDLTLETAEKYVNQLRNKIQQETWKLERLEKEIQKHRPVLTKRELEEVIVLRKYEHFLAPIGPAQELLEKARQAGVLK